MPPRRSCLERVIHWPVLLIEVSMPPRRSCFTEYPRLDVAVTAVSMPPRRSCFPEPDHTPPNTDPFQCHHGVPASTKTYSVPPRAFSVSMPPRRSCFPVVISPRSPWAGCFNATTAFLLLGRLIGVSVLLVQFQCHHGVPASRIPIATCRR